MLRMDQVHVVRHKVLVEGVSVRKVAKALGISRNTVRRYVEGAVVPGMRAEAPRGKPVLERVRPRLEAMLTDSPRWTGGKQRLTASQIHRLLLGEGLTVGVTLVREYVAEWKRQRREVFVPLAYQPGDLAEVDFFEVLVDVAGQRQKAWMLLVRLMHSGRDFAWLYPRQDQVCFLDGHVRAFEHFGAVPQRLAYDNLKAAVARVLVGSERELASRFLALASHYVFEASFARPRTGHDKGGVEARGKGIRWQHLVPIPSGPDLETISRQLLVRLDARCSDVRDSEGRSIADRFADERPRMLPLPEQRYRAAATRLVAVSRRSLVKVDGAVYSVWCEWAGLDVTAYAGVDEVELVGPDKRRVVHRRQRFGGRSVDYRHYLPELARKPQAVRQVAHELVRDLGEPFSAAWTRLVDQHGPKQAARIFAHVLQAVVDVGYDVVIERLQRGLADGTPLALAVRPPPPAPPSVALDSLPAGLQNIEVVAACARDYDTLLRGAQ
jgi:transposase